MKKPRSHKTFTNTGSRLYSALYDPLTSTPAKHLKWVSPELEKVKSAKTELKREVKALSLNRFSFELVDHWQIGPGHYNFPVSTPTGPSFEFGTSSRLEGMSLALPLTRSGSRASLPSGLIRINKDLAQFSPTSQLKKLHKNACKRTQKTKEVHVRKRQLSLQRYSEKSDQYQRKI